MFGNITVLKQIVEKKRKEKDRLYVKRHKTVKYEIFNKLYNRIHEIIAF